MGSEELKIEQECASQSGTAKGCFRQRDQHWHDYRGASFTHFAEMTLNGTLRRSPIGGGNLWVRGAILLEKMTLGACRQVAA